METESLCALELRDEISFVHALHERTFKFPSQGQHYCSCREGTVQNRSTGLKLTLGQDCPMESGKRKWLDFKEKNGRNMRTLGNRTRYTFASGGSATPSGGKTSGMSRRATPIRLSAIP